MKVSLYITYLNTLVIMLSSGVEISLEATTYTIDENGGNREVCAVLSSPTQIEVSIGLVTMNGSALSMFLFFQ